MKNKFLEITYLFICLLILAAGALFFYASSLPYINIKAYLDSLTVDGNVESYTETWHNSILTKCKYLSYSLFAAGIALLFLRKKFTIAISYHLEGISLYTKERRRKGWNWFLMEEKQTQILLLLIFAAGIILRVQQLFAPLFYDEAFTYISYVIKPLFVSLSDYSYPNNHLFHTFLAHLSWEIFGDHPWAVRLPAFIAGVLIIPVCWLLTKKMAGSNAALIVVLLVSFYPSIIFYSAIARGYSLVILFFLLSLLIIADPFFINKRGSLVWLFILSSLGFYSIPTYVYPYIVVMCCACLVIATTYNNINRLFRRLIFFNLLLAGFILILYLPVLMVSGIYSVTGNEYVASLPSKLVGQTLGTYAYSSVLEWTNHLSFILTVVLIIFVLFYLGNKKYFVAFTASTITLVAFISIHKAVPPPRVWSFILPVILILSGAGASGMLHHLFKKEKWLNICTYALMVTLAFFLAQGWNKNPFYFETHDNEAVALYLKTELKEGDKFIADIPLDYPIECYMREQGGNVNYLRKNLADQKRIVFINQDEQQNTSVILERFGIDTSAYTQAEKIKEFENSAVYEMRRK